MWPHIFCVVHYMVSRERPELSWVTSVGKPAKAGLGPKSLVTEYLGPQIQVQNSSDDTLSEKFLLPPSTEHFYFHVARYSRLGIGREQLRAKDSNMRYLLPSLSLPCPPTQNWNCQNRDLLKCILVVCHSSPNLL